MSRWHTSRATVRFNHRKTSLGNLPLLSRFAAKVRVFGHLCKRVITISRKALPPHCLSRKRIIDLGAAVIGAVANQADFAGQPVRIVAITDWQHCGADDTNTTSLKQRRVGRVNQALQEFVLLIN